MLKPVLSFCKIFFSSVCLAAQSAPSPVFNNTDSTTVNGKINGYLANQEEQFINYYTSDITGRRHKFAAAIQKNGIFNFKFLQQYEGDFDLQYGINLITAYAQPGENIRVEIDNKEAKELYHFTGAFKISGQSAFISRHILQFFEEYLPFMEKRWTAMKKKMPYEELIKKTQSNLEDGLRLLNTYIGRNNPPEAFTNWAKNYLTYEAGSLIILSPFIGNANKTITDAQLIDLLSPIFLQTENAWNSASYYSFLNQVASAFYMISISNNDYAEKWRDSAFNRVALTLDKADLYFSGKSRELVYYDLYIHPANWSSEKDIMKVSRLWTRFDKAIADNFLQYKLETKKNSGKESFIRYNVIERIKNYPVDTMIKNSLLAILQKEKGHYIYIDFWGAWCAPCMGEIPYYNAVINELKEEPVTFLFLAAETPIKDMIAVQEKYSIPGKFISLTKNETDIANDVFEFSGYPAHFFIDKEGNLVTKSLVGANNKEEAVGQIKTLIRKF